MHRQGQPQWPRIARGLPQGFPTFFSSRGTSSPLPPDSVSTKVQRSTPGMSASFQKSPAKTRYSNDGYRLASVLCRKVRLVPQR